MYTLVDLNWIKRDSDKLLFSKESPEYADFVTYCSTGSPVISVENSELYEVAMGAYKGQTAAFCKLKGAGKLKRKQYLDSNKNRKRGQLIGKLCSAVIEYIAGKNDSSGMSITDVDAFMVAHGAVLSPLSQNRHIAAKALIDAITPDSFISQDDLDNIDDIYTKYLAEIAAV